MNEWSLLLFSFNVIKPLVFYTQEGEKPPEDLNGSANKEPPQSNGVFTTRTYDYIAGTDTVGAYKRRSDDGVTSTTMTSANYDVTRVTWKNGQLNGAYDHEGLDAILWIYPHLYTNSSYKSR